MIVAKRTTPDGVFTIALAWDEKVEHFSEACLQDLAVMLMELSTEIVKYVDNPAEPQILLES